MEVNMFGITPDALFGGAVSGIGGLISNIMTGDRQEKANAFNAQQAQINRDWQEKMSNTAYQRAMADMKAAGLNPILAYKQGGAGTPGGAQGTATMAPATDFLTPAVSTAMAKERLNQELVNMQSTNKNLEETNKNLIADRQLTMANTAKQVADTALSTEALGAARASNIRSQTDQKFWDSSLGRVMRMIGLGGNELGKVLNPVANSAGAATRLIVRPADKHYHFGN